jgi:3-oxoadipate enol-lactonase
VHRLLDSVALERIALVGLSLGGMIAQSFALLYPDRVSSVVLAHTFSRVGEPMIAAWNERRSAVASQGMTSQVASTLERWFAPQFRQSAPLTVEWIAGMIRATQPAGYIGAAEAIQHLDYLDRLRELRQPTLVVAGSEDKGTSPAVAEMCAQLPNASLLVLENAGHLGCVDQPVPFTERVGEFLCKTLRPA